MADSVAEARQEVELARRAIESELDDLGASARAAVDIPAKIRRNPVRTVGLGAGAAFLLLGGPRRVMKAAEGRLFPRRRPKRLLPKDIDKTVDRLGVEDPEAVKAHLERDFAAYLQREHARDEPNARQSLWRTYDLLLGSVGAVATRELVKRFFDVPQGQRKAPAVPAAQEEAKIEPRSVKGAGRRRKS